MSNYWLQRISHEWGVTKPLLEKGYLSIGWQYLMSISPELRECIVHKHGEGFDSIMRELNDRSRSRWCLQRFAQFKPGDVVIVPLYDKNFAIVKVEGTAETITDLPEEVVKELKGITLTKDGLELAFNENDKRLVDIGFFVKIEKPVKIIPRSYAEDKLQMRMKLRQTNAIINDLVKEVDKAAVRVAPIDVHEILTEKTADTILDNIIKYVNADNFERVVKWYMEKVGASDARILSKNSPEKQDYADADVIAVFENLGITIYIQAKKHTDKTGQWAVEQISKYKEQQEVRYIDGMTYIPWVVSTADDFTQSARELADGLNVRLINGKEFARMLAEVGVNGIGDDFLK